MKQDKRFTGDEANKICGRNTGKCGVTHLENSLK